jgi:hypothetical protein
VYRELFLLTPPKEMAVVEANEGTGLVVLVVRQADFRDPRLGLLHVQHHLNLAGLREKSPRSPSARRGFPLRIAFGGHSGAFFPAKTGICVLLVLLS